MADKLVARATHELLISVDWKTNLDLCDWVNQQQSLLRSKEVGRALRKRFSHKNLHVVFLSLTVTEMLVKNCESFHSVAGSPKFIQALIKVLRHCKSRNRSSFRRASSTSQYSALQSQVYNKTLSLIQHWAISFDSAAFPVFKQAYASLLAQNVDFPQNQQTAPIFTPPVAVPPDPEEIRQSLASTPGYTPQADIESVKFNVQVLKEMLESLSAENPGENAQLVAELRQECQQAQQFLQAKLQSAEDSVFDSNTIGSLIEVNDQLLRIQQSYEDFVEIKTAANTPAVSSVPAPSVSDVPSVEAAMTPVSVPLTSEYHPLDNPDDLDFDSKGAVSDDFFLINQDTDDEDSKDAEEPVATPPAQSPAAAASTGDGAASSRAAPFRPSVYRQGHVHRLINMFQDPSVVPR